jgi:hypothetical protein
MDPATVAALLGNLASGVASNYIYDALKQWSGRSVTRSEVIAALAKIDEIRSRVDEIYAALITHRILVEKGHIVEVAGSHNANGSGLVIGLDVQAPARILPGTVVNASGTGTVIGTRIGGGK